MRLVTLGTARYSSDRPRRALSSPPTLATAVPDLGMLCQLAISSASLNIAAVHLFDLTVLSPVLYFYLLRRSSTLLSFRLLAAFRGPSSIDRAELSHRTESARSSALCSLSTSPLALLTLPFYIHPRRHLSTVFLATYPCVIPTMLSCR